MDDSQKSTTDDSSKRSSYSAEWQNGIVIAMEQKILFDAVTTRPQILSLHNEPVVFVPTELTGKDNTAWVTAEISMQKEKKSGSLPPSVQLIGSLEVCYTDVCARCGADTSGEFTEHFRYRIFTGKEPEDAFAEKECSEDEVESLYLGGGENAGVIDIEELIKEQIYLNMPMQNICSSSCQGRCPGCGVNLNIAECRCEKDYSHSPFAALAKLKQKEKQQ